MQCYKKSEERVFPVKPGEIFEQYKSLDSLIVENLSFRRIIKSVDFSEDKRQFLAEAARKEFSEEYHAKVDYGGLIHDFKIRYRTNFDPSLCKRPNVVELNYGNAPVLILREARVYTPQYLGPFFRRFGNNDLRRNYLTKIEKKSINFIPEPVLIHLMEEVYKKGMPRITPEIRIFNTEDKKDHYLRQFIGPALRDVSLDVETAGKYIGTVHSYGLIEKADRTPGQYVIYPSKDGGHIVNIDPDFFVWTANEKFLPEDLHDFLSTIKEIFPTISDKQIKHIKELRTQTIHQNRVLREEFYDALSRLHFLDSI